MASADWKWPISGRQQLAGTAGQLTFVGGAGDFDAKGVVRHGGDLQAQVAGTMAILPARSRSRAAASPISCA